MAFWRAFLLFACLLASFGARASSFPEQFVAAGLEIPSQLQQLGYDHFGSLYMQKLMSDMQKMERGNLIRPSEGWDVADKNGNGRATGHWEIHGTHRSIEINMERWNSRPDQRAIMALHEFLGAFGYVNEDKGYMSMSMWFLTLPETRTIDPTIVKVTVARIAKWAGQQYAGGVIGTGGAGEIDNFFLKTMNVLKDLKAMAGAVNDDDYQGAVRALGGDLYSNLEVGHVHMTKAYRKKLQEVASRPRACLQPRIICQEGEFTVDSHKDCYCRGQENDQPGILGTLQ